MPPPPSKRLSPQLQRASTAMRRRAMHATRTAPIWTGYSAACAEYRVCCCMRVLGCCMRVLLLAWLRANARRSYILTPEQSQRKVLAVFLTHMTTHAPALCLASLLLVICDRAAIARACLFVSRIFPFNCFCSFFRSWRAGSWCRACCPRLSSAQQACVRAPPPPPLPLERGQLCKGQWAKGVAVVRGRLMRLRADNSWKQATHRGHM